MIEMWNVSECKSKSLKISSLLISTLDSHAHSISLHLSFSNQKWQLKILVPRVFLNGKSSAFQGMFHPGHLNFTGWLTLDHPISAKSRFDQVPQAGKRVRSQYNRNIWSVVEPVEPCWALPLWKIDQSEFVNWDDYSIPFPTVSGNS